MKHSSSPELDHADCVLATTLPASATAKEKAEFGRGLALLAALITQLGDMLPNDDAHNEAAR